MKKALRFIKNIVAITLPTLLVLFAILEVFFRVGIPACTPPNNFFDEKEKLFTFSDRGEEGVFSIGRFAEIQSKWRINNAGWNSPYDYAKEKGKPRIAIIGDSYIEAFQVDISKSYPALLQKTFGDSLDVYAFGKSGNPFSQYVHLSRYINKNYNPDVLVFNLVHNDFMESIQNFYPKKSYMMQLAIDKSGALTETVPKPNLGAPQYHAYKRWLRKSALFRYLIFNLKVAEIKMTSKPKKGKEKKKFEGNIDVDKAKARKEKVFIAIDYLMRKIKEENTNKRVIFLLDAPRRAIYDNSLAQSNLLWIHGMMDSLSNKHRMELLDLSTVMAEDYQKKQLKFNSEIDHHWNEYGHAFVAQTLEEYLQNDR